MDVRARHQENRAAAWNEAAARYAQEIEADILFLRSIPFLSGISFRTTRPI